jgi:hypothetical protein
MEPIDAKIIGPPYQLGEYIVTQGAYFSRDRGKAWRVYMRAQFDHPARVPLFESPRKRDAIKHARQLERNRHHINKALAGDPVAVAENYKIVERLKNSERDN